MKNLVKVCRFKDNATRLYQLPTCVVLERGTIVEVELANGSTALGVTVSTSYCGDYEERLLRDMFNILPATDFKRVVAIYDRQEVAWVKPTALMKPPVKPLTKPLTKPPMRPLTRPLVKPLTISKDRGRVQHGHETQARRDEGNRSRK